MAAALLYDLPISHYCVKARKILGHKGIAYQVEYAPYHDRQDLLAVSGQDYVPYLLWEDKGVAYYEIPDFLESKKPTPTIYPGGQRNLARILERWAHDVVEEAVWKYVVPETPNVFADPRERWVFVELQERKRGPLDLMAQRKTEFARGVVDVLAPVEDLLAERPYLLGNEPSLADFALFGAVHPIKLTKNEFPKGLTRVQEWFARIDKIGK